MPPFAVVVPGRPLQTEFRLVSPNNLVLEVPFPAAVREFAVSVLEAVFPADQGVMVYCATPPFTEWMYVGTVDLQSPSAIFRAPWFGQVGPECQAVQIGLSVEPKALIERQVNAEAKEDAAAMDSALGIARDLFTFMQSFAKSGGPYRELGDVLIIPTNCIEKWMERFRNKHRVDPFFWRRPPQA